VTSPTKPAVEVTGPEKVVEAIALPHAQGFAVQSVHRQVGVLSARLGVCLLKPYMILGQKERPAEAGLPRS
jgi:hypothetical protein